MKGCENLQSRLYNDYSTSAEDYTGKQCCLLISAAFDPCRGAYACQMDYTILQIGAPTQSESTMSICYRNTPLKVSTANRQFAIRWPELASKTTQSKP
jgi:hypothetical protein